jgi:hypothetical protein
MLSAAEALLIQQLEGSRPHGSLCTLNGSDRVKWFKEDAVMGMTCLYEGGMELPRIGMGHPGWLKR